jgi:hypothetical protein
MNLDIFPTQILISGNPSTGQFTGALIRYIPVDGTTEQTTGFKSGIASNAVKIAIGEYAHSAYTQNEVLQEQNQALESQVAQLESDKAALAHQKDGEIAILQAANETLQAQINQLLEELNPPASSVDWAGFRAAIAVHPAYLRIVSSTPIATNINTTLVWVMGAGAFTEVPSLWNVIAQQAVPTVEEIAALNTLAAAHDVPFTLNEDGMIVG